MLHKKSVWTKKRVSVSSRSLSLSGRMLLLFMKVECASPVTELLGFLKEMANNFFKKTIWKHFQFEFGQAITYYVLGCNTKIVMIWHNNISDE